MKFWDTSAIVPLLVHEDTSDVARALFAADRTMVVSWLTLVEAASAIARGEHEDLLSQTAATQAFARLDELARRWREIEPSNEVRDVARRLLRVHRLRAADAIQLASATLASERRPASLTVVTLDERVESAALKEGFVVVLPGRR